MHNQAKVEALCLPPQVEKAVIDILIPDLYMQRVAKQAKSAEERRRTLSQKILGQLQTQVDRFYGLCEVDMKMIINYELNAPICFIASVYVSRAGMVSYPCATMAYAR